MSGNKSQKKYIKAIEKLETRINSLLDEFEANPSKKIIIPDLRHKIKKICQEEKNLSQTEKLKEDITYLFETELFNIPLTLKLHKNIRWLLSLKKEKNASIFSEGKILPEIEELESVKHNIKDWQTLIDGSAYKGQFDEEEEIKEGYGILIDCLGNLCWGIFKEDYFFRGNMINPREMTFIRVPKGLSFIPDGEYTYEARTIEKTFKVENSVSIDMIYKDEMCFNYVYGETKNGKLHGNCAIACEKLKILDSLGNRKFYKSYDDVQDFRAHFNEGDVADGELDVKYIRGYRLTYVLKNKKIVDVKTTYPFCFILDAEKLKSPKKLIPNSEEVEESILKLRGTEKDNKFRLRAMDMDFFYKNIYPISNAVVINSPVNDDHYLSLLSYRGFVIYKKYSDLIHENGRAYSKRVDRLRQKRLMFELSSKRVFDQHGNIFEVKYDFFYTKNILTNYIPSPFKMFTHHEKTPDFFKKICELVDLDFDNIKNFHIFVAAYECLDRIFFRFQYRDKSCLILNDDKTFLFFELENEEDELVANNGLTRPVSISKGKVFSRSFLYEGKFKVFMNENKSSYYSLTWNFLSGKVVNRYTHEFVKIEKTDDDFRVSEGNVTLFGGTRAEFWTEENVEKKKILKGKIFNEEKKLIYEGEIGKKTKFCEEKKTGYCYILLTSPLNNIQFNLVRIDRFEKRNNINLLIGTYYSYLSQRKLEGDFTVEKLSLINTKETKKNYFNESCVWGGELRKNGLYVSEFKNLSKKSRVVVRTFYVDLIRKNFDFVDEVEFYGIAKGVRKEKREFGLDDYDLDNICEEYDFLLMSEGVKLVKKWFKIDVDEKGFLIQKEGDSREKVKGKSNIFFQNFSKKKKILIFFKVLNLK